MSLCASGCASLCAGGCASLLSNKLSPPDEEESKDEDADKQPCETGGKTKAMIGGAVMIPGGKVSRFSQGVEEERARDAIGRERRMRGRNAMRYSPKPKMKRASKNQALHSQSHCKLQTQSANKGCQTGTATHSC